MPARGMGAAYQGMRWLPDGRRWAIYHRDRCPERGVTRCLWCDRRVACSGDPACVLRICLDHLRPVSQGGNHQSNNLVTACVPCNNRRRDTPFVVWMRQHDPSVILRVLASISRPLTAVEVETGRDLARNRPRYGKRQRPRHWTWNDEPAPGIVQPHDDSVGAPDIPW